MGFRESLSPGKMQATTDPTRSLVSSPDSTRYEDLDIDAMLEAGQLEFPDWVTDASSPGRGAPRGLLLLPESGPETNVMAPASTGIPALEPLLSSSAAGRVVTAPVSASQPELTSPPIAAASSSAPPGILREQKPQRVRGKPTEEQRAETSMIRTIVNCLRCSAFQLAVRGLKNQSLSSSTADALLAVRPQNSIPGMPEGLEQRPIVL
jgi:hypothetical protein